MAVIKVEAVSIDTYEITVDPKVWNAAYIQTWAKSFYEASTITHIAQHLATAVKTTGIKQEYDGFGYVKTYNKLGIEEIQFNSRMVLVPDRNYCEGISLKVLSENDTITNIKQ